MTKPAILGGHPIIDHPPTPYKTIGQQENAALSVIESGMLSGFIGANCPEFLRQES